MTASLTLSKAYLDLLPLGRQIPIRSGSTGAVARSAEASLSLHQRLLPAALRKALAGRAARRTLAAAAARLQETSPHLLDDVGLWDWTGAMPASRSPSRRSLGLTGHFDVHARSSGRTLPALGSRAGQPAWNAPDHWLR